MIVSKQLIGFVLAGLLATACSGTKISGSWLSQDYKGQVKNVYIIGIAKNVHNQMVFENTLASRLDNEGVKVVSSYTDIPVNQEADRNMIIKRMTENDCDSVLLTRLIGQKTTSTVTSKRWGAYSYSPGPYYGGRGDYSRPKYYNNWNSYYSSSYSVVRVQPTVTNFVTLTVESVLYDLKTEELIWSARLETDLEENIEEMIQKYVNEVAKDLKVKGLL
jgi:hypothetical protein